MQEPNDKPTFKHFEYGDLIFQCYRCGNIHTVEYGVEKGLQFILPTTDQHEWKLVCPNCNNTMRVFFKESTEETIAKVKARQAAKEAEEKSKELNANGIVEQSKGKRSTKRASKSNERSSKSNTKGDGSSSTDNKNT